MGATGTFSIEMIRGEAIESLHVVHAVIADRRGALEGWGDPSRPTIARSAIKAIQAIPLVATGAADHYALSREELALACASHSAEPEHVAAVLAWLDRLGLDEDDLECGADRPLGREVRREVTRTGVADRPVYNCCSGKHAGFLTLARHLGFPTAGYIGRGSPVQRLVTGAVAALTDLDLSAVPTGVDGCGIPVFAVPLARLAFAMARLVDPADLPEELARATVPLVDAARHAFWVSGTGRTEMQVTANAKEPVVIKTGAEGVFMAALPDRGLGIALKAADGTSRASQAAIKALLRHLDVLPSLDGPIPIRNKAGIVSGQVRPVISAPLRWELAHLQPIAAR
jgi:L-asparaginase II